VLRCVNLSRLLWVVSALVLLAVFNAAPVQAAEGRHATKNARKQASSAKNSRAARHVPVRKVARIVEPPRLSFGQVLGLHSADDPLELKSSVALVMDRDTNEVLFSKNSDAVLPIASITKLMTALVVTEANLPLDEVLTVTQDDVDTEKRSHSRLRVGTQLTRGEMLHLALMASENRAAHALGRHYPGGLQAFVAAMNRKAVQLGMADTRYVEPTGLSSMNQSSARDLAMLVREAGQHELIRELSTSPEHSLVRSPSWEIGLQKTGYISEAGRCVVMQATLAGRQLIMVLLDSGGRYARVGDAERIRRWLTEHQPIQAASGE
jgi:D-alanyl-D-alanine endopeptidase (penicillin-binding protein 7)